MRWLGDGSHRGQGRQAWTAVGLPPRYLYDVWGPYRSRPLANQPCNYYSRFELQPVWSRYLKVTEKFRKFWGIYSISNLEIRLEVIRGRWFWHQSKTRMRLPSSYWSSVVTVVLSCRVSEILELLSAESHIFPHPNRIPAKILGCSPWSRSVMLDQTERACLCLRQ